MAAAGPIALAMSVAGKVMGGIEENNAYRAQARVDEENARIGLLEGEQGALQTRKDERQQAGDMIAAMGGSGIALGSGSAADVIAESAYQRELEILNIRTRATHQANNLSQSAEDKRKAGKAALVRSLFSAASTALSGVSDMKKQSALSNQADWERRQTMGGGTQSVPAMRVQGGY